MYAIYAGKNGNGNEMVDQAPTTSLSDHRNIFPNISASTRTPEQGEKLLNILENAERGLLCGTKISSWNKQFARRMY